LSSDRAANQDHIRVPGRPYKLDPKTFGIIIRSENIDNFDIASVACSGVGVIHPKGFAKRFTAQTF
jgi:hypothetical protein